MRAATQGIWDRARWRTLAHLLACAAAGVLAGIAWAALSPRAHYVVDEQLHASLSERNYAEIVGGDATFTFITALVGLAIGGLTWAWFRRRGLLLVAMTVIGAAVMTLVAWQLGEAIGGAGLTERLVAAGPGDWVQMDLVLRSRGALAVGACAAITPVMLLAAFLPDPAVDEKPKPHLDG